MHLFIVIFAGNPYLVEVQNEGLKVSFAHIEQILRYIVTDDVIKDESCKFLRGLSWVVADGKEMFDNGKHGNNINNSLYSFFSQ